jgi:glyoxylase I family protein
MVTGIEHIAIASPDPAKLAQWYVDVLGFRINYRPQNTRTVFVKTEDGSMIEIIEAGHPPDGSYQMNDAGLRHLALTVPDFEAACQSLHERGVRFLADPARHGGNSLVFFADPDGNILHLLHRETPLP